MVSDGPIRFLAGADGNLDFTPRVAINDVSAVAYMRTTFDELPLGTHRPMSAPAREPRATDDMLLPFTTSTHGAA